MGNPFVHVELQTQDLNKAKKFYKDRNPLYLSLTLLYIGTALLLNLLWAILFLPIAFVIILFGVIAREERYLEKTFGQEYLRYKARVRRWI